MDSVMTFLWTEGLWNVILSLLRKDKNIVVINKQNKLSCRWVCVQRSSLSNTPPLVYCPSDTPHSLVAMILGLKMTKIAKVVHPSPLSSRGLIVHDWVDCTEKLKVVLVQKKTIATPCHHAVERVRANIKDSNQEPESVPLIPLFNDIQANQQCQRQAWKYQDDIVFQGFLFHQQVWYIILCNFNIKCLTVCHLQPCAVMA
jgi:hypothetical protein